VDVQIYRAGYYPTGRKPAYSPIVNVTVRVLVASNPKQVLEEFGYGADYSDSSEDPRYFTTSAALSLDDLGQVPERAAKIRDEISTILLSMARGISTDVKQVVQDSQRPTTRTK
jgi:hypothetical protein